MPPEAFRHVGLKSHKRSRSYESSNSTKWDFTKKKEKAPPKNKNNATDAPKKVHKKIIKRSKVLIQVPVKKS